MNYTNLTTRSRFIVRVAGAITGNDPWANGYSEYLCTISSWLKRNRAIGRDHGGNIHTEWFYKGKLISKESLARYGKTDLAFGWTDL